MNRKGKIISSTLSLLFISTGLYVYYLLNNIPEYFHTQLSQMGILPMIYGLLILGSTAITYNFLSYQLNIKFVYIENEKPIKNQEPEKNLIDEILQNKKDRLASLHNEIKIIIKANSSLESKIDKILSLICNNVEASQGIIYRIESKNTKTSLYAFATYAFVPTVSRAVEYQLGEGLVGVSAKEDRKLIINSIPEGYIRITSGLGKSYPTHLAIIPLKDKNIVTGILELALFSDLDNSSNELLDNIANELGPLVA